MYLSLMNEYKQHKVIKLKYLNYIHSILAPYLTHSTSTSTMPS